MQMQAQRVPQESSAALRRGTSALGLLTMFAIVSVVIFVSVPRLRSFALNENESDARFIASLLAKELGRLSGELPGDSTPRIEGLSLSPSVRQALSDGEFSEEGVLLRRHGFLFRVVRVDSAEGQPEYEAGTALAGERPVFAVQAWPWRHGRTGSAALLATEDGLLFRHQNRSAHWNGPLQVHENLDDWGGWRLLP